MTTKDFWKTIKKPVVALAPMDGYTDGPFRQVCKALNPELVLYTEFTSADGLSAGAEKLRQKLSFDPSERPILAQIFGKNPQTYIRAVKVCEDMGFTGIDINMGCPSRRVVNSDHGVALRKKPDLAFKLIETLAKNTTLPVSVKTRLGWRGADGLIEFCLGAQNAGADMLCIHGRTYHEPYNVPAQWDPIYELKNHVSIPVIGNGGIQSMAQGYELLGNLDGFMIGQASFGNPWVFSTEPWPSTFTDKLPVIKHHANLLIAHKGEEKGCREIRKHLVSYVRNFNGAKAFRQRLVRVESLKEIHDLLDEIQANLHDPELALDHREPVLSPAR